MDEALTLDDPRRPSVLWIKGRPFFLTTFSFWNLEKYILYIGQIHFVYWTKYILWIKGKHFLLVLPHLLLNFRFAFNCLCLCIWFVFNRIWMSWYYSQDLKRIRVEKSQHSMPAAASQDLALLHSCLVLLRHFIPPHRFSLSKTLKRCRRVVIKKIIVTMMLSNS